MDAVPTPNASFAQFAVNQTTLLKQQLRNQIRDVETLVLNSGNDAIDAHRVEFLSLAHSASMVLDLLEVYQGSFVDALRGAELTYRQSVRLIEEAERQQHERRQPLPSVQEERPPTDPQV